MAFNSRLWTIELNRIYMDVAETIILPSLPAIAMYFFLPVYWAQLMIPAFLLGKVISKFFLLAGITERYDRKNVLIIFLLISSLGSILSILPNMKLLLVGRLIQGIGVGCITAISTTLVEECVSGDFLKNWTTIGLINVWMPLLGSFLGGGFQSLIGWQASFVFLLLLNLPCILLTAYYIPATQAKIKVSVKKKSNYGFIFNQPGLICEITAFSLIYSGQTVIYTITPILFIQTYHWQAHFYWVILLIFSTGLFLGKAFVNKFNQITKKFICKWSIFVITLLASTGLVYVERLHTPSTIFFVLGLIGVYGFSQSALSPLIRHDIKNNCKDNLTTGAAFLGLLQSILAAVFSFIAAKYFHTEPKDLGLILFLMSLVACILFLGGLFKKNVVSTSS